MVGNRSACIARMGWWSETCRLPYNVFKHLALKVWYDPTYQLKVMHKLCLVEVSLDNGHWVDSAQLKQPLGKARDALSLTISIASHLLHCLFQTFMWLWLISSLFFFWSWNFPLGKDYPPSTRLSSLMIYLHLRSYWKLWPNKKRLTAIGWTPSSGGWPILQPPLVKFKKQPPSLAPSCNCLPSFTLSLVCPDTLYSSPKLLSPSWWCNHYPKEVYALQQKFVGMNHTFNYILLYNPTN